MEYCKKHEEYHFHFMECEGCKSDKVVEFIFPGGNSTISTSIGDINITQEMIDEWKESLYKQIKK